MDWTEAAEDTSERTKRARTSLDDAEAQEEDEWNLLEEDKEEILPPTTEEESQVKEEEASSTGRIEDDKQKTSESERGTKPRKKSGESRELSHNRS